MRIKQVRNATLRLDYGGTRFLIDPYLGGKESYPGFQSPVNSHLRNPRVDLKTPLEEIFAVDAVIVTHTHPDHWDEAAANQAPKSLPLFAQHEADAERIRSQGFTDVRLLSETTTFNGVSLFKTPGQHGTDEALAIARQRLGEVCGVVFRHPDEKTLYVAGDTIWNEHVRSTLARYSPDLIVLNAGDAQIQGLGSIIMGAEDVKQVYQAAPAATLLASHMEALNHCLLTRAELRDFADRNALSDRLRVPEDDEHYTF